MKGGIGQLMKQAQQMFDVEILSPYFYIIVDIIFQLLAQ